MSTSSTTAQPETGEARILVSVREAARLLSMSPWQVWKLCDSGAVPSAKVDRRILVRTSDVRAYADRLIAGTVDAR